MACAGISHIDYVTNLQILRLLQKLKRIKIISLFYIAHIIKHDSIRHRDTVTKENLKCFSLSAHMSGNMRDRNA